MKRTSSKYWIRIGAFLLSSILLFVSAFPSFATKTAEEMESELSSLNKQLDDIMEQINETSESLENTKNELARAKGLEQEQYESMMLRIKYMYENGNSSLLELIFTSSCWAEFINRAEYVSQIAEYDRNLLEDLVATQEEIAQKEAQLREDQENLAALQKQLKKKIATTSDKLAKYKEDLEKALEEAKRLEEESKEKIEPVTPEKDDPKEKPKEDTSSDHSSISASASDIELLAALIECEAGSSNYEALLAVGSVVVNRMKHRYYPDTVRGVIYQSGQFPPAHDGKVDRVLARGVKDLCVKAATDALNGKNNIGNCLSFRASSSGRDGIIIGDNVFF